MLFRSRSENHRKRGEIIAEHYGQNEKTEDIRMKDIPEEIEKLKALMKVASAQLDFERAIEIREAIAELRKRMRS